MLDSKHNIQYYKQVHQSQNDLQNKWHLIMYIICHGQIRLKTNLHYCQNETNKKNHYFNYVPVAVTTIWAYGQNMRTKT